MDDSTLNNGAIVKEKNSNVAKNCFVKFTESTSLHGLKYIGEKGNTKLERSIWIVSILTCIGICTFLIAKVWIKWNDFPVIVTFGETALSVWDIPFPLVTICPLQAMKNSKFKYRGTCGRNLTDSELIQDIFTRFPITHNDFFLIFRIFEFQSISLVCDAPYGCYTTDFSNQSSIDVMRKFGLSVKDYINTIEFNRKYYPDVKLQPILTSSGICYTFNSMKINHIYKEEVINYRPFNIRELDNDWNLDKGYPKESNESVYPNRVMGIGVSSGLDLILLREKREVEDQCSGKNEGFKLTFNLPNTPPPFRDGYIWINLNYKSLVTIEPKMITTSENLRKYDPEKYFVRKSSASSIVCILRRQCYFENERNLRFFHAYTQENCEAECFANLTLESCNCVPFYIPRADGTKICSIGKKKCVEDMEAKVRLSGNIRKTNPKKDEACHCLPSCVSLKYVPTLHQISFNFSKDEYMPNLEKDYDITCVQIYFDSSQFITSKRSELYGIADFLANCGGLLGVCLGFSVLSLVEIIYFMIFRCLCRFKKSNDVK